MITDKLRTAILKQMEEAEEEFGPPSIFEVDRKPGYPRVGIGSGECRVRLGYGPPENFGYKSLVELLGGERKLRRI